jgi:hypothetical protein
MLKIILILEILYIKVINLFLLIILNIFYNLK